MKTRHKIQIAALVAVLLLADLAGPILAETLYTNIVVTTSPTLVLTNRANRIKATVRPVNDGVLYYGDEAVTNILSSVGMYIAGTNQWFETKAPTQDNGRKYFQAASGSVTCRVEDCHSPE